MRNANNGRLGFVLKNTVSVLFAQMITLVLGFFVRRVFIETLGIRYLGYNAVFGNILQMLNMAEMGVGIAITSFLYRPIADGALDKISALMYLYRQIYRMMGVAVIVIGCIVSMFLSQIIPDIADDIWYVRTLFYLNLLCTASTYFIAYKRTLYIADQRTYIVTAVDAAITAAASVIQIAILYNAPNYIAFTAVVLVKTIISNVILSGMCDKAYSLSSDVKGSIVQDYKASIKTYVKEIAISKIGSYIYFSIDSIIISVFRGSILAGYLSNYTMITVQLNNVITQVLGSIQASLGNFVVTHTDERDVCAVVSEYFYAAYMLGNIVMLCVTFLIDSFITVWIGGDYTLSGGTGLLLGVNLLLTISIAVPSQLFIVYKLFRYDYIVVLSAAAIKIILSIVLVNYWGINGVLIGTFMASLVYLYARIGVLTKHVLTGRAGWFAGKIALYHAVTLVSWLFMYYADRYINLGGPFGFAGKLIAVAVISVVLTVGLTCWTKQFKSILMRGRKLLASSRRR